MHGARCYRVVLFGPFLLGLHMGRIASGRTQVRYSFNPGIHVALCLPDSAQTKPWHATQIGPYVLPLIFQAMWGLGQVLMVLALTM